jgi:2-polyprenyl-3-methyl-5-hydroxy-6-metoxy-1,4-benzoquinol methylase
MKSGLYDKLIEKKLLVGHTEIQEQHTGIPGHYLTIRPDKIETLSYASEWCFDQLRDAALLHLEIMQLAISHQMVLKDATAYNVQFVSGRPVFIDTLSFEKYDEKLPWIAYRQFCEHFLFPLLLEHYLKLSVHKVYAAYPDGIPVYTTANLLPAGSRLSLGCWLHVYLQNAVRKKEAGKQQAGEFHRKKLLNLLRHLESFVHSLKPDRQSVGNWNHYYDETIMGQEYLQKKKIVVEEFLSEVNATSALDIGANDGFFTRMLAARSLPVIAVDNDAPTINKLYLASKSSGKNILPLVLDITAPTPSIGFDNQERADFFSRKSFDLMLALALVHHLVIGKNIPLPMLAGFFSGKTTLLIIEFIPKEDLKVKQMLISRTDVFDDYDVVSFEKSFERYFEILKKVPIEGTYRTLYFMKRR